MQVNRNPWERERKDKNRRRRERRRQRGDWVPCGLQKPPNLSPIFPEREGGAYWEFGSKGGRSPKHSPPSHHLKCLSKERGSREKEVELGALVVDRAGEGGCQGGLGLSLGWSHTCTASPRSRWSAAGTGPAMRTPLVRSELCAPSSPPRRWGTASSTRPSPALDRRAAFANVCFQCQRSIRGRTLSGHPNRCLDRTPKAHRGKSHRMAKVQTWEQNTFTVMEFGSGSSGVGTTVRDFKYYLVVPL